MRFTVNKPRILTAAALTLLASSIPVGMASADTSAVARSTASHASSATSHAPSLKSLSHGRKGCVVLAGLTEHFIEGTVTGAGPDPTVPQIGQHGVYSMQILNAAGEEIGKMLNGTTDVYAQAPNGHFLVHGNENVQLNDGSIHAEGDYDLTATLAHTWQSVPAVGTSGRYRGLKGFEFFYDVTNPLVFKEAFVLCR